MAILQIYLGDGKVKDMNIRFEKGINEENASLVCKWSNEKGEKFQEQWMGDLISFPIDYEKLKELPNLHSIYVDDEFMGTIQQVRIEEDNIHVGRFMINPAKTGMGYGEKILNEFIDLNFKTYDVKSVTLSVYYYNEKAKKLYEKVGFKHYKTLEDPILKYIMKRYR